MSIKGTAIAVMPKFIVQRFGEVGYQRWLEALPPESQQLFESEIMASHWYPLQTACTVPTETRIPTIVATTSTSMSV